MKTIFFAFLLSLGVGAYAQKATPPAAVTSAFKNKFAGATNIKWIKEGKTEYEAEFSLNGKKYSANFSTDGAWKETETPIASAELPNPVMRSFSAKHSKASIKQAAKIETAEGKTTYEVEYRSGKSTKEAFYDDRGNPVKS